MHMDVVDHLQLDHEHIRTLLDRARDAEPHERAPTAARLVDALVRHETAEAALVRPRTRETRDGHPVAWSLDRQERTIGRLLASLEMTDPDGPDWQGVLQRLREAVLHHVAAEEHAEHPRLRGECSPQTLVDLGRRFVRVTGLELTPDGTAPPAGERGLQGSDGTAVFAQAREVIRRALLD